jgi:tRNA pseudouridine32 synthase/23S rRNA pseudouridine746 synthase
MHMLLNAHSQDLSEKILFNYRPPEHDGLDITYQDCSILVLNKPAGLLSVPGRAPEHKDCMITRVQQEYPDALIVHRLDMSTSGLLVMARNCAVHREMNRQFAQRQVKKSYVAVVKGQLESSQGRIELPLICDWPNRPRQIVDHANGKPSRTDFQVLDFDNNSDTTRIKLKPITGRTHQLRVHMQALGHPILGDDLYADEETLQRADRLLLHASSLSFTHPETLEPVRFCLDVPF